MKPDDDSLDPRGVEELSLVIYPGMTALLRHLAQQKGTTLQNYVLGLLTAHIEDKLDIKIPPGRPTM